MPSPAHNVLELGVEKLAEELVLADLDDIQSADFLVRQVTTLRDLAEAEGLASGAQWLAQMLFLLEKQSDGPTAHLAEELGSLIQKLQELLSGNFADRADGALPEMVQDGSGWSVWRSRLPGYVSENILRDFLENLPGTLDEIQHVLLGLENNPEASRFAELRRHLHTIKSDAGLLGQKDVELLCHAAEDLLRAEDQQLAIDPFFLAWDWLKRQLDWVVNDEEQPESHEEVLAVLVSAASTGGSTGGSKGAQSTAPPSMEDEFSFETVCHSESQEPEEDCWAVLPQDRLLLGDFLQESLEHLENVDVLLLRLEKHRDEQEDLNGVFRAFHTIKGLSGFFGLEAMRRLAHHAETVLDRVRKNDQPLTEPIVDLLYDSIDVLKTMIEALKEGLNQGLERVELPSAQSLISALMDAWDQIDFQSSGSPQDDRPLGAILMARQQLDPASLAAGLLEQSRSEPPRLGEILIEQGMTSRRLVQQALARQESGERQPIGKLLLEQRQVSPEDLEIALSKQEGHAPRRLGEVLVKSGQVSARDVSHALRSQTQSVDTGRKPLDSSFAQSVKVDSRKLDLLVDTIGELVIAETLVVQNPELRSVARSPKLVQLIAQLDKISRDLQEMATGLRLVPIQPVFDKMARLARDLSRKTNKPLHFHLDGEDTQLDKSVVDRIGDPLLHLVRNAVDHGLESDPDQRVASGKPAKGNLSLRAWQRGGSIWIELQDDGQGLNPEALRQTAIQRGLIPVDSQLGPKELQQLIFLPGFSTSRQVTDISGRGVGMDVVRESINALRGTIHLDSEVGRGTTFRIQLPLTMAIIEGMLVRAGGQTYVLPSQSIVRLVEPAQAQLEQIIGRGVALRQPEGMLPLVDLAATFGRTEMETRNGAVLIIVEHLERRFALLVNRVLGQQQVVIKSLGATLRGVPGISGGCILGDGRVGLILDVGGLTCPTCEPNPAMPGSRSSGTVDSPLAGR
ncbi:MAG: chemotaxis protein CheA [Calditrichaeota bacterium]|nr:chemotaxis protein CheA [Calditrichota bacterium]